MVQGDIFIKEMQVVDIPFLLDLWAKSEVMRYADEFPHPRGWTRKDEPETAWQEYRRKRKELGTGYCQLVLNLEDGTPVGESFRFPLDDGFTFGRWEKPEGVSACMSDIKLDPDYWNRGLGTEFMHLVVQDVFERTDCDLFVVPPNLKNPPAIKVYLKSGFVRCKGMKSWHNHFIMELPRDRFEELAGP